VKRALTALAFGGATFGVAAWNGYALEMLWLPAVVLAAAWPPRNDLAIGRCVRRLRRRE
jgi:hypothetical protein